MALSEDEDERLTTIISTLGEARAKLYGKNLEFYDDIAARYEEHGTNLRLSGRQWQWLENLMERYG